MLLQKLRGACVLLFAVASFAATAAPPSANKPPAVTLTSPTSGATFKAPATIQLSATASDPDGTVAKVEFFRGKTLIATVTAAPFNYTWTNVAAGSYSITAKATDNAGAAASSAAASITVSATVNAPPTVALTAPASGSSYAAPATIQLSANAADADGTIAKVEFFRGTTLIAAVTSAPYAYSWTNVGLGTYSITAKATDNAGATATSGAATVNVVSASTLTTITSPTPATRFDWPITDVSGTFSGPADTTILVSNGNNSTILSTLTGTTTFVARNVPLSPGSNTLTATAIRRDGTSSAGSVTVEVPQRLIVLTSPTNGATYEMPPSITFEASGLVSSGTIQRVDYYHTFVGKLGTATTPPYTFVWNNPPKGRYSVYAWMVDDQNVGRQSQEISFTVVGPNVPPSVSLTAPANNAAFGAPASFNLQATASDSDGVVSQVEFLQDGQLVGITNMAPYGFAVSSLPAGTYTFTARASDDRGATTTSAPATVKVVTPPVVSMATSVFGGKVAGGSAVTLSAAASTVSGSIARVEFYANGVLVGTATAAPFSWTWSNLALGEYLLVARAIDSAGVAATSAPVQLSVVPGPKVSVTAPAGGASFFVPASVTIAADASAATGTIASVAFFDNGTPLATVTAAPYSFVWNGAAEGTHAVTAVATDDQGVSSTSAVVNITVVAPSIVVTSPQPGAAVPTDGVLVRGRITAPRYSGVTVNGQIAYLDAQGYFYVNDIVPQPGDNAIVATLSTPDEVRVTTTVVVTPVAPASTTPDLQITYTETVGPITAEWRLRNPDGIRDVTFDYWGDGTTIFRLSEDPGYVPGGTDMTLRLPYNGYGIFEPIVTVEDMRGNIYQKQFALQARSPAEMDVMITHLWARMLAKLKANDIPGALTATTGAARPRYQSIFENLQPDPSIAVDQLGTVRATLFNVDSAEYMLIREKAEGPVGYPLYFIRSRDGVWRVDAM